MYSHKAKNIACVSRTIICLVLMTPWPSLSAHSVGQFAELDDRLLEAEVVLGLSCVTQQVTSLSTGLTSERIVCLNSRGIIEAAEYIVFETHTRLRVSSVFAWIDKSSGVECRHLLSTTYGHIGEAVRDRHTVNGPKHSCKSDTIIVHQIGRDRGNMSGRRARKKMTLSGRGPLAWAPPPTPDAEKSKLRLVLEDMSELIDVSMERFVLEIDEVLASVFNEKKDQALVQGSP